jgi:hypothetical protein
LLETLVVVVVVQVLLVAMPQMVLVETAALELHHLLQVRQ